MIDYKALTITLLIAAVVLLAVNIYQGNNCECSCQTKMIECKPEIKTVTVEVIKEKDCNCYQEALKDIRATEKFLEDIKK